MTNHSYARCTCGEEMTPGNAGCRYTDFDNGDGIPHMRIPYGQEKRHKGPIDTAPCHDCNVQPGGIHHIGCDWEECPTCGMQVISCSCSDDEEEEEITS